MRRSIAKSWVLAAPAFFLLLAGGCATTSYVPPTAQEAEAAKHFKKTVAIVAVDDRGSHIPGLQLKTASQLEYWLGGRFNLAERRRVVSFISTPQFMALNPTDQALEAGRGLGADLALFVRVTASPYLGSVEEKATDANGNAYLKILQQPSVKAWINYDLLDAKTGQTVFSATAYGVASRTLQRPAAGGEMDVNQVLHLINTVNEYQQTYPAIVEDAISYAASQVAEDVASSFPMDGEVLEVISDTEVSINIGSAYGLEPGRQLTLWKSAGEIKDPRTGLTVSPKEHRADLEVVHVTGGLTCIAKGSKKALVGVKPGDKVSFT